MSDPSSMSFPTLSFPVFAPLQLKDSSVFQLPPLPELPEKGEQESSGSDSPLPDEPKKGKSNTACPHKDRKHYAKGMCNNCYHKKGRSKLAHNCPHKDRPLYAKGKCQFCYLHFYHKTRVIIHRRKTKYKTI